MIAVLLIALSAGSASALMFASMTSGAPISLVLVYLAPLPLMVAALGWGPLTATIGGIAAASIIGAVLGLPYCLGFALTIAVPAWWLGHLALLGRPASDSSTPDNGDTSPATALEWYPLGRILLWIAGFSVVTMIAVLLTLGSDPQTISGTVRRGLLRWVGVSDPAARDDLERLVDLFVLIVPFVGAPAAMMRSLLNLWLAAKIAATSGRLKRPWPDLKAATVPPMTLVALSVGLGFCFVGGLIAMFAQIAVAALAMAYAVIGFAVIHTLTLALKGRPFWLGSAYATFAVTLPWSVLAMATLALADGVFGFRQRFLRRRPPPLPVS